MSTIGAKTAITASTASLASATAAAPGFETRHARQETYFMGRCS